jgi:putative endopeptidase
MRHAFAYVLFLCCPALFAQQQALSSLPYTPSLEPKFIDHTVDPCTDFYHYACGNWIKSNPIPADESRWNVYGKLADENRRLLWGILDSLRNSRAERTADEARIGDLFNACMSEKAGRKTA